jgi:glycosyltransferase 2 family protein
VSPARSASLRSGLSRCRETDANYPERDAALAPSRRFGGGRRSRLLIRLATIAVTALFAYVALSGVNLNEAWRALRTSDYWWLIPAVIALALGVVARALRWRSLFAPGRRPPRGATLNATVIGYFYNSILPARAGEAARVLVLNQRSASPVVEITGTVVVERVYDIVGILIIFFVAEPWLAHVSWFAAAAIVAIGLAVAIATFAALLVIYGDRPLRLLVRPLGRFFSDERLQRAVAELVHGLSGLHNRLVAVAALAWTILAWMLSAVCGFFVMLAFHLDLPFAASVLVQVAIGLGMILPSAPAAVGVFEGATLIALRAYGLPHATALPYALVFHLVNFIPFVLAGALLLHYNALHPRNAESTPLPAESTSLPGERSAAPVPVQKRVGPSVSEKA